MKLPVLTAAGGASWEAGLLLALERSAAAVTVVRRCVDVVDLVSVAASGQARAALVSSGLRRLDADAVDQLVASGVVPVAVIPRTDPTADDRMAALGIQFVVPEDADAQVVAGVLEQAVSGRAMQSRPARSYALTTGAADGGISSATSGGDPDAATDDEERPRGSVIAVWGPTGAPGRTTVALALADELARLTGRALLVDADVYGGVIAASLGLLDESPGIAAACRQAGTGAFGVEELAALAWQVNPALRVLTGIPRPERWPELRPAAIERVLGAARLAADFTVVDCGFCVESDEELSFDSLAPRRNGATLAVLDAADVVVVVGAADPIGLQRLIRALSDLREAEVAAPIWVVVNKLRGSVVPGDPAAEVTGALERFAGRTPAAVLPFDPAVLDEALAAGRTLAEVRPKSPLRKAMTEFATALAGVPEPVTGGRRRRG